MPDRWTRHLATSAVTIAVIVTIHGLYVRPAMMAEMRLIAESEVRQRLDAAQVVREAQLEALRAQLEQITERIDQFDSDLAVQIQGLSVQVHQLADRLEKK